jgi:hypothetical protein
MKPLTDDQLRMNQQASTVAAGALSEPVIAATRCEQITMDMQAEAAGVRAIDRALMRGTMKLNKATSVGRMANTMLNAGLPNSFVLAVTANQVHAIEDKHSGGDLVAGKVLSSWDRDGLRARLALDILNVGQGVPDDRRVLILTLPIEGGHNRYLKAVARNTAAVGGKPYKFAVAKDAPSQGVIDALVKSSASTAPNIMIGGTSLQDDRPDAGCRSRGSRR